MDDEAFMGQALLEAEAAASIGEVPVGAVLVDNATGKVLARAHNRRETDQDPTAHAELLVIRAAAREQKAWRLLETSLYVTLEPCAMCAGAIVLARIPRVVFATRDPKAGALASRYQIGVDGALNHAPSVTEGILEEAAAHVLQRFFQERRARAKPGRGV